MLNRNAVEDTIERQGCQEKMLAPSYFSFLKVFPSLRERTPEQWDAT